MDGALSSSRYGPADRGEQRNDRGDRSQGGGDRRRYGGGRGRGGGGHHHHHGQRRHHPYRRDNNNNNRGGRGPPRGPRNRFSSSGTTQSVDPETAMLRQLSAMVGRVGEGENVSENSKNIGDLANVLCSETNAPLFLKYEKPKEEQDGGAEDMAEGNTEAPAVPKPISPQDQAGPLAHLLVSCVMSLPLSTVTYAGLTLAVHEQAPSAEYGGFANRCLTYAMQHMSRDLDEVLLEGSSPARPISRVTHILRYLALLGRVGIVKGYNAAQSEGSVAEILQNLTTAACKAASIGEMTAACLLAYLVLSTLPYAQDYLPSDFVSLEILEPLESTVMGELYKSSFVPGIGSTALLLADEQLDGEDDEEEEEEDDESEDGSAGQKCDTLQDLMRVVKRMFADEDNNAIRFTPLSDAPWKSLNAPTVTQTGEGAAGEAEEKPLVYSGEPVQISFLPTCKAIAQLTTGDSSTEFSSLQCYSLSGVVFGRLPIFGAPPDEEQDAEEEDEEDDMDDASAPKNESLQAYQKEFGLLDRFFLAEAVRDCLLNHPVALSDTGVEYGSAKDVALQVWSITKSFPDKKGIEYGILEAFVSLIVQSDGEGTFKNAFLARVLLELTRLQPSIIPQALAIAVSNVVAYYMPSLTPLARENLSRWFAFHLTNTDYQWPTSYWEHWASYVKEGTRTSRGEFVRQTLTLMATQLSAPDLLVTKCLPQHIGLIDLIVESMPSDAADGSPLAATKTDLQTRIWEKNEDPDLLRAYIVGDELSESVSTSIDGDDQNWWRTRLLVRALMYPATREHERLLRAVRQARDPGTDSMEEEPNASEDVLTNLVETLVRYRPSLLAALASDAEAIDSSTETESDLLISGEASLLGQMASCLGYSRLLLEACTACLAENQVVSARSVLKWILGEGVLPQWWVVGSLAVRIGLTRVMNESVEQMEGMIIDGAAAEEATGDTALKRTATIVENLDPIVREAASRVCTLLQKIQDPKKRFTHDEIDLVEGFKMFLSSIRGIASSTLSSSSGSLGRNEISRKDALEKLDASSGALSGGKLASLVRQSGVSTPAGEVLASIMDAFE